MRADKFFATTFGSRTKAADALNRGVVLRCGKALKPSDEVKEADEFTILKQEESFVSNGGYKLSRAFQVFQMDVTGKILADLGASTGGFTDCLLQKGTKKVYCVDVGESLLEERIATDSRVVVMDRTNARYLSADSFPEKIDAIVSDLSFISLKLVLPAVSAILSDAGEAYLLIKPQFEAGKKAVGKSGIVSRSLHPDILGEIYDFALALNLAPLDVVNAPVREKKNVEYVARFQKGGVAIEKGRFLERAKRLYEEGNRA